MADPVAQVFADFDALLRPDAGVIEAGALERELMGLTLGAHPRVARVVEAGSFAHGTAVGGSSRFDLVVVLSGPRPRSAARAAELLSEVADGVGEGFVRLVPAFDVAAVRDAGAAEPVWVADAAGRWVRHLPAARRVLFDRIDTDGSVRALVRLVLAWKHRRAVPLSSYYIETAVIRQTLQQPSFSPLWDVCWVFERLADEGLVPLPDPTSPSQVQSVRPAASIARALEAQFPLERAASSARGAVNSYLDGDLPATQAYLRALFGDDVPEIADAAHDGGV